MSSALNSKKRSLNSPATALARKKLKMTSADNSAMSINVPSPTVAGGEPSGAVQIQAPSRPLEMTGTKSQVNPTRRIKKLAPARPFPTVPTSVSATGPRSAHTEGKNYICITRKTSLGAYMRRCKKYIIEDGYKTLHLSAMGAAIPLLLQLSLALPPILPFALDEIHTEVLTGTVQVQDELIPEDEDEDITYQTRGKSTMNVIIRIGDGEFSGGPSRNSKRRRQGKTREAAGEKNSGPIVYEEPEQVDMEMV